MPEYKKRIAFIAGPLLFILVQLIPFEGLSHQGRSILAGTAWIALWWIMEPVSIPVTSLLPIVLFPLSGGLSIADTTASYGNPIIYLFLGGFVIGLAVERWNLHKRVAFGILHLFGLREKRVILGMMVASAFLSFWISSVPVTIMMLPIGISLIQSFGGRQPFARSLLLGIAYAASIGGNATLIGSTPNIIMVGIIQETLQVEISFLKWMLFATPFVGVLLLASWLILTRYKQAEDAIAVSSFQLPNLGKMNRTEKRVLVVFSITVFLWLTRTFLWNRWFPSLSDPMIAIMGALLMFLIPSGVKNKGNLMNWEEAKKLPWGTLLLFGAGLAIAKGFSATDLTQWLGNLFIQLDGLPEALFVLIIIVGINAMTEINSNTATASMMIPLVISIGHSLGMEVLPLLAAVSFSASSAFMLPVSTPPNAIVFSTGKVSIPQMMRAGFALNLTAVLLIFLTVRYFWGVVF